MHALEFYSRLLRMHASPLFPLIPFHNIGFLIPFKTLLTVLLLSPLSLLLLLLLLHHLLLLLSSQFSSILLDKVTGGATRLRSRTCDSESSVSDTRTTSIGG